jgi:hypothetical protein
MLGYSYGKGFGLKLPVPIGSRVTGWGQVRIQKQAVEGNDPPYVLAVKSPQVVYSCLHFTSPVWVGCMYVCMYICMYVCMYALQDIFREPFAITGKFQKI